MAPLNVVNEQKPRQIAARVLGQRRVNGPFVEDLLEIALANAQLSSADRGLCQEIVYGVVRRQATLDWLILRKTNGREQKPALQNLLRLGLYQIFWLDRIPEHAAVHETVELAKQSGFGPQAGFVNAVLRGYLREADETKKLLAELEKFPIRRLDFHIRNGWSKNGRNNLATNARGNCLNGTICRQKLLHASTR